MRGVKFRAWHESEKEMIPNCNQGFEGDVFNWKHQGQPIQILQFTGLQDKDGVDIYEGDIVQYLDEYNDEPSIHFVQYLGDKGYPAFELSPELGFECNGFAGIYQGGSGHIIVIGNIHQNPELLESTK